MSLNKVTQPNLPIIIAASCVCIYANAATFMGQVIIFIIYFGTFSFPTG